MHRRIITTVLAVSALAPAAAHAAGGGPQDPLLSGYGSPGTGAQVVLPAPAPAAGKSGREAARTLDPAVTETPRALSTPAGTGGSSSGSSPSSSSSSSSGSGSGTRGATSHGAKGSSTVLQSRPVAERRLLLAAARAGKADAPLVHTSDLAILVVAVLALAGFALTARPKRRHG